MQTQAQMCIAPSMQRWETRNSRLHVVFNPDLTALCTQPLKVFLAMPVSFPASLPAALVAGRRLVVLSCLLLATACAAPQAPVTQDGIYDPNEARNRRVHAFNKKLDTNVIRPVSRAYGAVVPDDFEIVIGRMSDNLGTPASVLNQILQGDIGGAAKNTLRFALNSTLGFAGAADIAADVGLPEDETDFGETLHVWGMAEGPYGEGYVTGPTTRRDSIGGIVDFVINPLGQIIPAPERYAAPVLKAGKLLGERNRFANTIDSVLYDSADSYAQARLLYLQKRRAELGIAPPAAEEIDPFALDTEGF